MRGGLCWRERGAGEARKARGGIVWGGKGSEGAWSIGTLGQGTETFHLDGTQQRGLGACQVRSGAGQPRHGYLGSVAYRLLMRSLPQRRAPDWARRTLTTLGQACRAVKAETLERMIDWVGDKLTVAHWALADSKAVLVYS